MALDTVEKDPQDVLDYGFFWASEDGTNDGSDADTGWLQGDTVVASTWSITEEPATGANLVIDSEPFTTKVATVWLSGGTVGQKYKVTNHIVTAAGREKDRTLVVKIKSH